MKEYLKRFVEANSHMSKKMKIFYLGILVVVLLYLIYQLALSPKYIVFIVALYTGVVWHELGHGIAALILGDDTAKKAGRISLNPLKHIDPIGIIIPILLMIVGSPFVIGWAKPIPIAFYKIKRQRVALFMIGISGVVVNAINCIIAGVLLHFLSITSAYQALSVLFLHTKLGYGDIHVVWALLLVYIIIINLALAIFNLLPIPPLDGSRVIGSFLPTEILRKYFCIERFGFVIIIALLAFGLLDGVFSKPFYYILQWIIRLSTGIEI